jgi:hypothetical protein
MSWGVLDECTGDPHSLLLPTAHTSDTLFRFVEETDGLESV